MDDFQKQGWIRVYRKALNSSVWENPIIWMVWSWCLLKANHQKTTFPFNGSDVELLPGQFITGIKKAVSELKGVTCQKYRTAIKYLEKTQRITIKSTNKFTLIIINKWQEYQQDNIQTNKQLTNKQQTTNKQLTTYNNDNNNKNDKNDKNTIAETSSAVVIPNLLIDKQKHIQIIGLYAKAKQVIFNNPEQQRSFIKRNLRPARELVGYDVQAIINTMKWLIDNADFKWTIETVGKFIDEDLSGNAGKKTDEELLKELLNK